jgi:hypothetical protein
MFIFKFLVPAGQMGEAREPSKKNVLLEMGRNCIGSTFAFFKSLKVR